jgi:hypothetical protein
MIRRPQLFSAARLSHGEEFPDELGGMNYETIQLRTLISSFRFHPLSFSSGTISYLHNCANTQQYFRCKNPFSPSEAIMKRLPTPSILRKLNP